MNVNRQFAAARLRIALGIERSCSNLSAALDAAWSRERERVDREFAFARRSLAQLRRRARERNA